MIYRVRSAPGSALTTSPTMFTVLSSRADGSGSGSAESPQIYPVMASPMAIEGIRRPIAAKNTVATARITTPHIGMGVYRAMAMPMAKAAAGIKAGSAIHFSCKDCVQGRIPSINQMSGCLMSCRIAQGCRAVGRRGGRLVGAVPHFPRCKSLQQKHFETVFDRGALLGAPLHE